MTRPALWLLASFLLSPLPVRAGLVINEIFYNAVGDDTGREWIEIYNPDSHTYEITGWKFAEGGSNHNLTLVQATAAIEAGAYAVIADDGVLFMQDYPQFTGPVFDSSFSLSNSGETIALADSYLNQIDQVTYSSAWGGSEGYSLERISAQADGSDPANWGQGPEGGTPGSINSQTPVPTPTAKPAPTVSPTPLPEPAPEDTPVPTPTSAPVVRPYPVFLPHPPSFPGLTDQSLPPFLKIIFSRFRFLISR
jgi:hypothetical protein